MKLKKYILTILSFLCTLTIFAERKLAIISDPDGFTNVRSGQGIEFSVIDTIKKDEFFYCDLTEKGEWIKILPMKSKQIEGYIHRSGIQLVENFDYKKQKELIAQILNRQKILADNFQTICGHGYNMDHITAREELELYNDIKYSPILDILQKYFCSTNDTEILQLFFSTMWADSGSANELPSFAIGKCFVCKTNIIIAQLKKIQNVEQKELIFDRIEWGLLNYFSVDENEKSNNKEFNKLKKRLETERKNASR